MSTPDEKNAWDALEKRVLRIETTLDMLARRLERVEKQNDIPTPVTPPPLAQALREEAHKTETPPDEKRLENAMQSAGQKADREFRPASTVPPVMKQQDTTETQDTGEAAISKAPCQLPALQPGLDVKDFLRKINMLPPTGSGSMEAQIGQWWLSRIGAFLFVIGAVLGVAYLTRNMTPAVRFAELLAGSIAVSLLGLWLERRIQKFGAVIFGMGLALIYFSMFAGYVFPAVKVFHSPITGSFAQLGVVALIVAASLWRNSQPTATMAVLLGYVAALFSCVEGLDDYALVAALLLGVAGGVLYLWRGWPVPYLNAVPLAYLTLTVIAVLEWGINVRAPQSVWEAWGWLLAFMVLFGACDATAKWRGHLMGYWPRRFAQITNTSGALLIGYLVTRTMYHDHMDTWYFVFGGLLIAAAVGYYVAWKKDVLIHVYFVKGTALVTVGLMTSLDARTRWTALAVESLVLLFSATRSRLKVVEAAMAATWLASFGFFTHDIIASNYLEQRPENIWLFIASGGIYLLLSAIFLCLQARWVGGAEKSLIPSIQANASLRDMMNVAFAFALGIASVLFARVSSTDTILPMVAMAVALALGAVAVLGRHWIPLAAALLPFATAHWSLWGFGSWGAMLWWNGLAVTGATAGLGVWSVLREEKTETTSRLPVAASKRSILLYGLCFFGLIRVFHLAWTIDAMLMGGVLVTLALGGLGATRAFRRFVLIPSAPMLFALAFFMLFSVRQVYENEHEWDQTPYAWMLWVAMIGAILYAAAATTWRPLAQKLESPSGRNAVQWFHAIVATLFLLICLPQALDDVAVLAGLGLAAVLMTVLSRWPGLKPAALCAVALFAASGLQFLHLAARSEFQNSGAFITWSIIVAALMVGYAIATRWGRLPINSATQISLQWLLGAASLFMLYLLFYIQRDALRTYVTVLWGVSAFAVLGAGFLSRLRSLRVLALAAFTLCIARAFLVDILETLDRIFAFLALGISLLVVGFLYTKYKDVIERFDTLEKPEDPAGPMQ